MKAVIVSSSYSYLERVKLLKECYEKKGYETTVLLTDFIHVNKSYTNEFREGYRYIKTKSYKRNISFQRLYSHHRFAKDVFAYLKKEKVDLLHVLIPANSLAKMAQKYKKMNPDVKLHFDIIDLWPETMPIQRFKNMYPFQKWKKLRDDNLDVADKIYCECNLFRKVMHKENDTRFEILYWAKKDVSVARIPQLCENELHLCYLGSINNVIDIDYIVQMCEELGKRRKVVIHIIGNGEKQEELLQRLKNVNTTVNYYGLIFDSEKKQKIFDQCHFGVNVMKSSVCVGLTMKSLDYFQAGLPIINNIEGDTTDFVDLYKIGFNGYPELLKVLDELKLDDYLQMRNNARKLYEEKFTEEAFARKLMC